MISRLLNRRLLAASRYSPITRMLWSEASPSHSACVEANSRLTSATSTPWPTSSS